jgi:dTDP-4-amino-4,6-dideoxygalactose transaminase
LKDKIDSNIKKVLDYGQYIMGSKVIELEEKLVSYTGSEHCISYSWVLWGWRCNIDQ